jgi:hypothetical protein
MEDDIAHEFGTQMTDFESLNPADAVILAAPHSVLKTKITESKNLLFKKPGIFIDARGAFEPNFMNGAGDTYWRL